MRATVVSLLIVLVATAGAGAQAQAGDLDAPSLYRQPNRLWVATYHPCYQWDDVPVADVPWGSITHLILGYLLLDEISAAEYTIEPPSWYSTWFADAQTYIDAAHQAGRQATCMLGGAGSNPGNIWNSATSEANVAVFAANIVSVLQPLGFDGADLDWEDNVDYAGLVRLAEHLRAAWPEAVITIPTAFTGSDADDLAPAAGVVDAFMPMTYIAVSQWGGWTLPSPLTPLHIIDANKNSIDWVRQAWVNAGVPASKLVMGVGGFGLVWGDTNGDGLAPIMPYSNGGSGLASGEYGGIASDNTVTQVWLDQTLAAHPGSFTEEWDATHKISYWHTAAESQQVTVGSMEVSLIFYETPRSIRTKLAYVHQYSMQGMMFWTLSQMSDGSFYPNLEAIETIFSDGFESGGTNAWSAVSDEPQDVSRTCRRAAAGSGRYRYSR